MSTNDAIRWGLLGTSRINLKLMAGASGTDTAEVVAVGSRSAEAGQAFAEANGIPKVHASYEAFLADPDIGNYGLTGGNLVLNRIDPEFVGLGRGANTCH